MNDLVSIVMPMYNDGKYIEKTLQSVLSQTYPNFELIVVDDCSTDDSITIVKRQQDKRIRLFENPSNSGAAHSRNVALKKAKGKWIAFLDADDCWYPEKLEKQLLFMEKNKYDFSFTEYYEADGELRKRFLISGPRKITSYKMRKCCYLGCLTVMYNREKAGLIQVDEKLLKRNDYAIWIQVSKKLDAYLLKEPLAIYRRRENGISTVSGTTKLRWEKAMYKEYVCKTAVMAWVMACRAAFFTILKRKKYKTSIIREN